MRTSFKYRPLLLLLSLRRESDAKVSKWLEVPKDKSHPFHALLLFQPFVRSFRPHNRRTTLRKEGRRADEFAFKLQRLKLCSSTGKLGYRTSLLGFVCAVNQCRNCDQSHDCSIKKGVWLPEWSAADRPTGRARGDRRAAAAGDPKDTAQSLTPSLDSFTLAGAPELRPGGKKERGRRAWDGMRQSVAQRPRREGADFT